MIEINGEFWIYNGVLYDYVTNKRNFYHKSIGMHEDKPSFIFNATNELKQAILECVALYTDIFELKAKDQ